MELGSYKDAGIPEEISKIACQSRTQMMWQYSFSLYFEKISLLLEWDWMD